MRSNIADYNAVVEAASKFTRSVAEGNSKYANVAAEEAVLSENGKVYPAKPNALIFDQF
jgi:L-aminopeptidase/D-esterase-like protein